MIRIIRVEELPKLADLAKEFYSSSKFLKEFKIDRFIEIWSPLLSSGSGVILVEDVDGKFKGCLGGIAHRDLYSDSVVACEMFWFVSENSRGCGLNLYRQFESWARDKGAASIQMVHLSDSMPDGIKRIYERLGYESTETRYTKELI